MISFQYMPYSEHSSLKTEEKLNRILRITKQNKILLMQGRLKPHEEAKLIEETMSQITRSFTGISFCTISPVNPNGRPRSFASRVRDNIYYNTFGKREVLTIIGPATIVKEIRKNPSKIDILLRSGRRR